jgi:DNA repair exonuclease SbcCD ATPase subunit
MYQVLRLAEAHIKHEKEELKSLNVVLERNKQDSDQRFMALEARMRATEKDKQEFDMRIYREREQIRALEAALNDIRARSGRTQDMVHKAYTDEQVFLDHVRKLKSSFAGDRSRVEQEVQRVRAQLMQERQMREEAVHRESTTLARYRASEASMPRNVHSDSSMLGGSIHGIRYANDPISNQSLNRVY